MHRSHPSLTTPKYRRVYEHLRERIDRGMYQAGQRVPSEAQLMQRFDVSRTTVIRALRDLETAGMLKRRRGAGSFVAERPGATRGVGLAFFAPFIGPGQSLPYVEGLIHQHVARLAGEDHSRLLLQGLPERNERTTESLFHAAVDRLLESKAQGVLFYPAQLRPDEFRCNRMAVDRLVEAGVAVVLIDREVASSPGRSEFTRIGYDNRRGGHLLVDHLIRQGCRRIAFVGHPGVSLAVYDRLAGYYDGHRAHGRRVPDSLVRLVDTHELTLPFCRNLLRTARPDGVVGVNDRTAAMVGRHLTALGRKIGPEVKLAGFDDDPIAALLPAPLTTIKLPVRPFAEAAYEALRGHIANPALQPRQIIIDVELIVRESTTR